MTTVILTFTTGKSHNIDRTDSSFVLLTTDLSNSNGNGNGPSDHTIDQLLTATVVFSLITSIDGFSGATGLTTVDLTNNGAINAITTIANGAFNGCTSLVSANINFPTNLTTIGSSAFAGCTLLTTVNIPINVDEINNEAFSGMPSLAVTINRTGFTNLSRTAFPANTSLTFANITQIANNADDNLNVYKNMTNIVSITLGPVTSIGASAFEGCTGITGLDLNIATTRIADNVFNGCTNISGTVTIPSTATQLGVSIFKGCTSLTTFIFSSTNTTIPTSTCEGCTALASLTIADTVSRISANAFKNCSSLTCTTNVNNKITFPTHLTLIESNAFEGCSNASFQDVNLSSCSSLTSIGVDAFKDCTNLEKIQIGSVLTTVGNNTSGTAGTPVATAFSGTASNFALTINATEIKPNIFNSHTSIKYLHLLSNLTTIGASAFAGCSGIVATVTIPPSVTTMGESVFVNCTSLVEFTVGSGSTIARIPTSTCEGCSSLTNISVPNTVTTIGEKAFKNCTAIRGDYIRWQGLTTIEASAFEGCSGSNLTSIDFTSATTSGIRVATIGDRAFNGCTNLSTINLGGELTSIGASAFVGTSLREVTLHETLNKNINIGDNAFKNITTLHTVSLGKTTTIGVSAFEGTIISSLITPASLVTIGQDAFKNIIQLASITFFSGTSQSETVALATIGASAFEGCNNASLTTMTFPKKLSTIGANAFNGCSSLQTLRIPFGTELDDDNGSIAGSIGTDAFAGTALNNNPNGKIFMPTTTTIGGTEFVAPATNVSFFGATTNTYEIVYSDRTALTYLDGSITYIGNSADTSITTALDNTQKTNLEIVDFSDSIESVCDNFCSGATSLTEVILNKNLRVLGDNAFSGCTSLVRCLVPEAESLLTTIGASCFSGNTSMTTFNFQNTPNIESFGNEAFKNTKLDSNSNIVIPSTVTFIGTSAFEQTSGSTCTTITIDSIQFGNTIPSRAFFNCSALTTITVASGINITNINDSAFEGCSSIISLPSSLWSNLVTIGDNAFRGCSTLASATLASSLTNIGTGAFQDCVGLVSAAIPASLTLTSIPADLFNGCTVLTNFGSIPVTVSSIDARAFKGTAITSVVFPRKQIETYFAFGADAFMNCANLVSISKPPAVQTNPRNIMVGANTFSGSGLTSFVFGPSSDSVNGSSITVPSDGNTIGGKTLVSYFVIMPVYPSSNACFPCGTLVRTDQGEVAIEKLCKSVHTVRGRNVLGVTAITNVDDKVVLFKAHSLFPNVPCRDTYVSLNHKVFYDGNMHCARVFAAHIDFPNVIFVPDSHSVLYNVLLSQHVHMVVSNLLVETLDPSHALCALLLCEDGVRYERMLQAYNACAARVWPQGALPQGALPPAPPVLG